VFIGYHRIACVSGGRTKAKLSYPRTSFTKRAATSAADQD
jgi:hypothetical protein